MRFENSLFELEESLESFMLDGTRASLNANPHSTITPGGWRIG